MGREEDLRLAVRNGGLVDLTPGERVWDGDGDEAVFLGYGDRAPLYVDLEYRGDGLRLKARLPNSELTRRPKRGAGGK